MEEERGVVCKGKKYISPTGSIADPAGENGNRDGLPVAEIKGIIQIII